MELKNCFREAGEDVEITTDLLFDGVFCCQTGSRLFIAARIQGKHSVNTYDIAWANASPLALCTAGPPDCPAVDTMPVTFAGTVSPSVDVDVKVARLLFVERAIKIEKIERKSTVTLRDAKPFTRNTTKESRTTIAEKIKAE